MYQLHAYSTHIWLLNTEDDPNILKSKTYEG